MSAAGNTNNEFQDEFAKKLNMAEQPQTLQENEDTGFDTSDEEEQPKKPQQPAEQNAEEEPDVAVSAVKPLDLKRQRIVKDLPLNLTGFDGEEWLFPSALKDIYCDFRGRDVPTAERFSAPCTAAEAKARKELRQQKQKPETQPSVQKGKKKLNSRARARLNQKKGADGVQEEGEEKEDEELVDLSGKNKPVVLVFSGAKPFVYGSFSDQEKKKRNVRFTPVMESQIPGFSLRLKPMEADGQKVDVFYNANSLARHKPEDNLEQVRLNVALIKSNEAPKEISPSHPEDTESGFVKIPMGLVRNTGDKVPFGPPAIRPQFTGIGEEKLKQLVKRASEGEKLSIDAMLLVNLYTATDLTIYREWPTHALGHKAVTNFSNYWKMAMVDAATQGNFPYYQRWADKHEVDINSIHFRPEYAPIPPHMVTNWRVTYDENGTPVEAEPESWAAYRLDSLLPDASTKALAARIGVGRTWQFENAAIRDIFDSEDQDLIAQVQPLPGDNDYVWIKCFADNSSRGGLGEYTKPAVREGVRCKMTIFTADPSDKLNGLTIPCFTQDDIFRTNASLSAIGKCEKGKRVPEGEYGVKFEFVTDVTSTNRQHAALCQMRHPREGHAGTDFQHWFLGAAPTIKEPGKLYDEVKDLPDFDRKFKEVLGSFGLNPEQQECAESFYKSKIGLHLLWGPPGTGKTYLLVAMTLAFIKASHTTGAPRRKIIACAPTNDAVGNLAKEFAKAAESKGHRVEMCIFPGGSVQKPAESPSELAQEARETVNDAAKAEGENLEAATWRMADALSKKNCADPALWDMYLHNKRKAFVNRVKADKSHKWNADAKEYAATYKLSKTSADQEEKKKANEWLDMADDMWNQRYLGEEVDIVFCTNNSSAHEVLEANFHPQIFVQDEAGLANSVDMITTAAANLPSLLGTLLAGDHKQNSPVVLSHGANECIRLLNETVFAKLMEDDGFTHKTMLAEQRRMGPTISPFVNTGFYLGKLRDHDSVKNPTGDRLKVRNQLYAITQPLRSYTNEKTLRFTLSVDGPGTEAQWDANSKSWSSAREAGLVVDLVHKLLNAPAAIGGRKLLPSDIFIIAPYKDQSKLIRRMLAEQEHPVPVNMGDESLWMSTSVTVQGRERPIVIQSKARNTPQRPFDVGFTRLPKQIAVDNSRAQEAVFVIQNALPLAQAYKNEEAIMTRTQHNNKLWAVGFSARYMVDNNELVSYQHALDWTGDKELNPQDRASRFLVSAKERRGFGGFVQPLAVPAPPSRSARPGNTNDFSAIMERQQHEEQKRKVYGSGKNPQPLKKVATGLKDPERPIAEASESEPQQAPGSTATQTDTSMSDAPPPPQPMGQFSADSNSFSPLHFGAMPPVELPGKTPAKKPAKEPKDC